MTFSEDIEMEHWLKWATYQSKLLFQLHCCSSTTKSTKKFRDISNSTNDTIDALREKCHTEFFLSVFSPNAGKYGPEKTPYLNTSHAV